jgi:uncharacterized membrane protein
MVDEREREVNTLFTSTDPAVAKRILDKYGVQYVYVGGQERGYYPPAGIEKFAGMVGSSLDQVYQGGAVVIYHVRR